jgi:hypothetical protein
VKRKLRKLAQLRNPPETPKLPKKQPPRKKTPIKKNCERKSRTKKKKRTLQAGGLLGHVDGSQGGSLGPADEAGLRSDGPFFVDGGIGAHKGLRGAPRGPAPGEAPRESRGAGGPGHHGFRAHLVAAPYVIHEGLPARGHRGRSGWTRRSGRCGRSDRSALPSLQSARQSVASYVR